MKRVIEIRPLAERDINDYAAHIASHSTRMAIRFYDSLRDTFESIADWPHAGRLLVSSHARLQSIRWRAVKDFPNRLVFYRLTARDRICIIRFSQNARAQKHSPRQR